GYYTAYDHLSREDVDYVLHLGDHIYETDGDDVRPDTSGVGEAKTLEDYRAKYRMYLSDPSYREVRRLFAWVDIWDDHEVVNDYAGATARGADPRRFGDGYQAFLEYMPLQTELVRGDDGVPTMRVNRTLAFGDLAEIVVLDERQFRMPNPC